MLIALYARVSTQRQVQTQSLDQQLEHLCRYAQAQGWSVRPETIFRDDGYSGATLKRPGLDRLRDHAAAAHCDRLLITAPDRLARNYVHQVLLVEELERHGAQVEFLERPMSQDPHDRLLLQIRGAVAEYERSLISERMRRGRLRKRQAGTLLPWTRPPYGYRLSPDQPRDPAGVRVVEAEAAVVRNIFAWFVEDSLTLVGLIRRLHHLGIVAPQGGERWSLATLRSLLTNPTYLGQLFANRRRTTACRDRHSALRPVGHSGCSTRPRDPAEWIPVATVPAIISSDLFALAQEQLARNRRMAARNHRPNHPYLLRGLVSCGLCRCGCTALSRAGNRGYYVCRSKVQGALLSGGKTCPTRYIPTRQLDDLIWRDLCAVLDHPESIAWAMERAVGDHWLPQELQARKAALTRGRTGLSQQLDRLTEAYLESVVPLPEYQRRRHDIELRLQALDRQEQQLIAEMDRQHQTAKLAAHAEDFCQRIRTGLAQTTFEQQRAIVELLIDRVIVTNDQVEIRYVIPTGPKGEQQRFCHLRMDYLDRLPIDAGALHPDMGHSQLPQPVAQGLEVGGHGAEVSDLLVRFLARATNEDTGDDAGLMDIQAGNTFNERFHGSVLAW
jgi:site-specific DNA recombinase